MGDALVHISNLEDVWSQLLSYYRWNWCLKSLMFETIRTDVKDVIACVFVFVISMPSYYDKDDFPREKKTLMMIQATRTIDINRTLIKELQVIVKRKVSTGVIWLPDALSKHKTQL